MDDTFASQIAEMGGEDISLSPTDFSTSDGSPVAQSADMPNVVDRDTFAAQIGSEDAEFTGDDEDLPQFTREEEEDEGADPYARLADEDKELLAFANSPLGKRFLADARKLEQEYGSADNLLAALDAPVIDEDALWQEACSGPVAAMMQAKDEYGDPKYAADDPVVQALAQERYERLKDRALLNANSQRGGITPAQQREADIESAATSLLKMYPNADAEQVKAAIASGGDGRVAAQRSHAHTTNKLTQAKAEFLQANPGARRGANAPRPLSGGRSGAPQSGGVPDPITNPKGFAAYEKRIIAEGARLRQQR